MALRFLLKLPIGGQKGLAANAQESGDDVIVTINAGDEPFLLDWDENPGAAIELDLADSPYTLTGRDVWTNLTLTETGGDEESVALGSFDTTVALSASAQMVGHDLVITITAGDEPFTLDWDENPGAAIEIDLADSPYTLTGAAIWNNVTLTETEGNTESANLGDFSSWLVRDTFTTDDANPLTDPRTCEPIGTLDFVDTGNKLAIASGHLDWGTGTSAGTDPRVYENGGLARANGRTFGVKVTDTRGIRIGWNNVKTGAIAYAAFLVSGSAADIFMQINNAGNPRLTSQPLDNTSQFHFAIVQRSLGHFYFIKGGAGVWANGWTLAYVDNLVNQSTQYAGVADHGGTAVNTQDIDDFTIMDLGSPFTSDFGYAGAAYSATPSAGATLTGSADGITEITWTAVTSEVFELMIRRTDDNNCWIIRADQGAGTVKLFEKNAGSETERATQSITISNGTAYRLMVAHYGNAIRYWFQAATAVPGTPVSYTSASFNNTETGIKAAGFTTAVNLACYPRVAAGAAATELGMLA